MMKISFVYFDVGGVAIRDFSDTTKWHETTDYLHVPDKKKQLFFDLYDQADDQICLGELSIDNWIRNIQDQLDISVASDFSFLRYFIDNFAPNRPLWPVIKKVKENARVGLLTDMWTDMYPELVKDNLLPPYEWDAVVDSTLEHVRKPMPEIYKLAQSRAGVPAEEIFFIDNRQKNLDGAAKAGWQTYLYDSRDYDQATSDLMKYLILQGFSL